MKIAKLTDLNIEYHIADIEGIKVWCACDAGVETSISDRHYLALSDPACATDDISEYNPMTNKTILFDLQVKYKVKLDWVKDDYGVAYISSDNTSGADFDCPNDIPRAILMCIIENKLREQAK